MEDVLNQWREELGNPVLGERLTDPQKMTAQKFGLIPPQLTASEKNLILREERRNGQRR